MGAGGVAPGAGGGGGGGAMGHGAGGALGAGRLALAHAAGGGAGAIGHGAGGAPGAGGLAHGAGGGGGAIGGGAGGGLPLPHGAGRGAGDAPGPGAGRRDDAGNPLPYWLLGNDNHGAESKKPPLRRHMGISKINPKELDVYRLTVEYRTGDAETIQMNERLVALYNTLGDKRVELYEKASDDIPSRKHHLDYRKEKEILMRMIGDLQVAIRNRNAKPYPFPKIFGTDPPI